MWPRVVEIMLGFWLLVSPFIFEHSGYQKVLWVNDLTCGAGVILLGCCSFWKPLSRAHLITGLIAVWLIGFGYFSSSPPAAPGLQNDLILGLLLMMFAVIPNEAAELPSAWKRNS